MNTYALQILGNIRQAELHLHYATLAVIGGHQDEADQCIELSRVYVCEANHLLRTLIAESKKTLRQ